MRFSSSRLFSLAAIATGLATAFADTGSRGRTELGQKQEPAQVEEFQVLRSERIENYSLRIKASASCEETVQYSGYIDNSETDDHFFFWFFGSRSSPEDDPVVLWLNGGPGCSSMTGAWMELGPCLVDKSGTGTVSNKNSWNSVANVIFLDQPVNVGYSYGKSTVSDSRQSARDVAAFLQLFFGKYPEYADNPFHISGESYGGHYLPALATEIISQNKKAAEGHIHIPFESMLIGNGLTEPRTQFANYETYTCANDTEYKPIFDEQECEEMKSTLPRCEELMTECYESKTADACTSANSYCQQTQQNNYLSTGLNPYDIRKQCEGNSGLCYEELDAIDKYANDPEVRKTLGASDEAGDFTGCSDSVGRQFSATGDGALDYSPDVASTLAAEVRVLLYVGDMDWICNWYGNLAWSKNMEWPGKKGYGEASVDPWYNKATLKEAGEVRSYNNLTFLRVFDAGHMVPYDQPENALDFFGRWLKNEPLAGK